MLRIHSFLQGIYGYVKAISKRLYRICAIITTGAAVIAVIAFSSHEFGGSGKSHMLAEQTTELTYEEKEEVEADTEAKVQTETTQPAGSGYGSKSTDRNYAACGKYSEYRGGRGEL